ncbi:MAG: ribonuclease HII [Alphaproteobacteria bacterium]|nr:ribonuclease HII [Alphaproteobacteria bacterium]
MAQIEDWQLECDSGWPDRLVFGVDEAGRGPWAGPVTAAAICLPEDFDLPVDDSKKLTAKKREMLFEQLILLPHGIGEASVAQIDEINILQATYAAMARAVEALAAQIGAPHHVLVDGNRLGKWPFSASAIVGGDGRSRSIAAASVLAKVTRDRQMQALDEAFPGYGWASNKGYGAKAHALGLEKLGVTSHHRRSYAPIAKILAAQTPK